MLHTPCSSQPRTYGGAAHALVFGGVRARAASQPRTAGSLLARAHRPCRAAGSSSGRLVSATSAKESDTSTRKAAGEKRRGEGAECDKRVGEKAHSEKSAKQAAGEGGGWGVIAEQEGASHGHCEGE
jgi:hypothetical protein